MKIEIIDHSAEVKAVFEAAALRALEKCGLKGEEYAKKLCPVKTGILRNSITHAVDASEKAVYIGTNSEYAAYVELGTGIYYPGGRNTPWVYEDAKGNWHLTHGQRAQAFLKPAMEDHLDKYRSIITSEIRGA